MSYQPPEQTMVQPVQQQSAPKAKSGAGRKLLGLGLIVGGLLAAVTLFLGQQSTYSSRIDSLERAVAGFATDLSFEKPGTFTLYYEHAGEVDAEIDGSDETVTLDADEDPSNFDLVLRDDNGDDVRLSRLSSDLSYDSGGHQGVGFRQAEIEDAGDYVLEVIPEDPDQVFAIALGIGTADKPSPLLPLALALVGVLLGLAVLLTGRSKKASAPAAPAAPGYYNAPAQYGAPQQPPAPGYGAAPPYQAPPAYQPPPTQAAPYAPYPGAADPNQPPPQYQQPPQYQPPPTQAPWQPAPPAAPEAPQPPPGSWQPPGQQ